MKSNVIEFPLQGRFRHEVCRQASDWLAKLDANTEENPKLQQQIRQWQASDRRRLKMLLLVATFWEQL